MIIDLLTSHDGITGALGHNWRDGTLMMFNAKALVMATGGTGHLYKYTDNPTYMTGDGYAAMDRAGAELGYDLNVIDVLPENTAAKLRSWFEEGPREEMLARLPDGTVDEKLRDALLRFIGTKEEDR